MSQIDLIIVTQSDVVDYSKYSKLPLDKIDMYSELVFPRMVHYEGAFRSHYDIINRHRSGHYYTESDYSIRRDLLNIWNMPGCSGILVANYLQQFGIRTLVINNLDSEFDLFAEAYSQCDRPPLVGLSSTFYLSYNEIKRLTRLLRSHDDRMEIVLGGAFANEQEINHGVEGFATPMRKLGIDYTIHSFNSEVDLARLCLARKSRSSLDDVPNLAYRQNGTFHATPKIWNDPVLDNAPIAYDTLDIPSMNRTFQMRTASGCPFSCHFCSYPETAGGHFALSLDKVDDSIRNVLSIPGVDRIIFIDDTFNVPLKRFRDMCDIFCKYDFEWFSFLRCQYLDDETARLMRDSGCRGVYLGIESSSDTILKNMNKKATREKFLHGLELLKKYDITTMAAFIIGYPGETDETIAENVEFIENAGIDFYCLKEFYLIPHTEIARQSEAYGLVGSGARWKHDTMTSEEAHLRKIDLFKSIKRSTYVDPDTSLWYLAYLYDQGFQMDAINSIQTHVNDIMRDQINGHFDDNHAAHQKLSALFGHPRLQS